MLVRLLVIVLIALPRFPGYLSPSAISCVAAKGVSGMAKRRANGEGKLRKRDGRWEGRYTTEHAPGTDKAIYRDVLGRIQEETKKVGEYSLGAPQSYQRLHVPQRCASHTPPGANAAGGL